MAELPHWEQGTPGVLCAAGPHPIPVSTAVRVAHDRLLLALGTRRETLRRLREQPRSAFCLLGREVAFTAHGRAAVVAERLEAADFVAAVELRVERVQDHLADGRTELLDGARWRWRERRFGDTEERILAELRRLGEEAA